MSKKYPWYVYAGIAVVVMIVAPITSRVLDDYHVGWLYRALATSIVAFAVTVIFFYLAGHLSRWIGGDKA
jgi:ATP/ADP translocase